MKITPLLEITDAILTASNQTEADEAEYLDATVYAADALVMVTDIASPTPVAATHKIYRSLQAANQGNDPTVDSQLETPLWWEEVSSTNKYKMWDPIQKDQTVSTGPTITATIEPGQYTTTIVFFNLQAYQLDIVMTSTLDGEVFNDTISLVDDGLVIDEWTWCFSPIQRFQNYAIEGLPPYDDTTIELTITHETIAKCGICVINTPLDCGDAQWGAEYGILDRSVKSTDSDTQQVTLAPGDYAESARLRIAADTRAMGAIRRGLTDLRATPCAFVATTELDGAMNWGFIQEWRTVYTNPSFSIIDLDVTGLV